MIHVSFVLARLCLPKVFLLLFVFVSSARWHSVVSVLSLSISIFILFGLPFVGEDERCVRLGLDDHVLDARECLLHFAHLCVSKCILSILT